MPFLELCADRLSLYGIRKFSIYSQFDWLGCDGL